MKEIARNPKRREVGREDRNRMFLGNEVDMKVSRNQMNGDKVIQVFFEMEENQKEQIDKFVDKINHEKPSDSQTKDQLQQKRRLAGLLSDMKENPDAWKDKMEITKKKDGEVNITDKGSGASVNFKKVENEVRTYNEFSFSRSQRRGNGAKVKRVRG
jgi:hypothetical protein